MAEKEIPVDSTLAKLTQNNSATALRSRNIDYQKLLEIKTNSSTTGTLATGLLEYLFLPEELLEKGVNLEGGPFRGSKAESRALSPNRVSVIKRFCIDNSNEKMSDEDIWREARNAINKRLYYLRTRSLKKEETEKDLNNAETGKADAQ